MGGSVFHLLTDRRFAGLFVAQFTGAANDNLFKNALGILIVYRLGAAGSLSPQVLVSIAAGLFILPFFLFSARAGLLADRYEKSRLILLVKLAEVAIALCAAASLAFPETWRLLTVLALLGIQASFFGPLKYAVLPELLATGEIVTANALVEGGTFLAILLGTIAGGLLILGPHGGTVVSALMLILALVGLGGALAMPRTPPGAPGVLSRKGLFGDSRAALAGLGADPRLWPAVLGISWFWFVGATFVALFPAFAQSVLAADETVVTLLLTMFSLGIGAGAMLCAHLSKGRLSTRWVPWAGLGIALFAADLGWGASAVGRDGALAGARVFLAAPAGLRVLADLVALAACGGLYVVPLYATLQMAAGPHARARAVAANNIVNAALMVASAVAGALLLAAGFSVGQVFLVTAAATCAVALALGWRTRKGRISASSPPPG